MRFIIAIGLTMIATISEAEECGDNFRAESTFCESEKFGISDESSRLKFLARAREISENPSGVRGGHLDEFLLCVLESDASLADAYRANAFSTRKLIDDIVAHNGLVTCRTDPKTVLELLSRVNLGE